MKKILITFLCAGWLGYGAQMIPWIPNIMAMGIADASQSTGANVAVQKDHQMPLADKGHETANAKAVEHQESLREALRDCLRSIRAPAIEIHMTNIEKRGYGSVTAEAAVGMIAGFGVDSYTLALEAMVARLREHPEVQ